MVKNDIAGSGEMMSTRQRLTSFPEKNSYINSHRRVALNHFFHPLKAWTVFIVFAATLTRLRYSTQDRSHDGHYSPNIINITSNNWYISFGNTNIYASNNSWSTSFGKAKIWRTAVVHGPVTGTEPEGLGWSSPWTRPCFPIWCMPPTYWNTTTPPLPKLGYSSYYWALSHLQWRVASTPSERQWLDWKKQLLP